MLSIKQEKVGDETYNLLENGEFSMYLNHEIGLEYGLLHDWARANFKRTELLFQSAITENGFEKIDEILPKHICEQVIQHRKEGGKYFESREGVFNLLQAVFNGQVDQKIVSEFGSEYMPVWYNFSEDTPENTTNNCSFLWHCDGGPREHIKIMIYLNDFDEHQGNTIFSTKEATQKLKDIGYVFCILRDRKENIKPLVEKHDIQYKESVYQISAGDGLIFSPYKIMHRGVPPKSSRHVLHICIVPSPYHWAEIFNVSNLPTFGSYQFINYFNFLRTLEITSSKNENEKIVQVDGSGGVTTKNYLQYILNSIFEDKKIADDFYKNFIDQDITLSNLNRLDIIFSVLENSFKRGLDQASEVGSVFLKNYQDLISFKERVVQNRILYSHHQKPNPNAVFWPDPTSQSNPQSVFDMLPYVRKFPIMDKTTPIGSAGSCFAFEISEELQKTGFNYVITERNDDPRAGVIIDGYNAGDPYVKFCASWGILFNSPSFMQLAEKAFGKRQFKKILYNDLLENGASGLYFDPYRENVFFTNKQAYLENYDKHIQAVRDAFLKCKVFIITLGLNECWQFVEDGTFMSRNPRPALYPFLRHRTLTVEENINYLQRFLDIIREYNPEFKLIVTLSPIPFLATGRADQCHIVEANCHSKSVLRVVAEEFVVRNKEVYYLPSYELVMHCVKNPWEPDTRHVNRDTVKKVMGMFDEMFVGSRQ